MSLKKRKTASVILDVWVLLAPSEGRGLLFALTCGGLYIYDMLIGEQKHEFGLSRGSQGLGKIP
jgi:hypothetical protein